MTTENIATVAEIQEATLNMLTATEFVKSTGDTLLDQYGKTRKTLTGTINDLGWDGSLGNFEIGKIIESPNQVLVYAGKEYRTTEVLPYTVNGVSPTLDTGTWLEITDRSDIQSNTDLLVEHTAQITSLQDSQQSGVVVFQTYTLLDAYTPTTAQETGSFKVVNDTDTSLNGYYSWVSDTTYIKDASLVENEIDENNTSDAVSGKAVFDHVSPLFGTSFPGASEYWETLSTASIGEIVILDEDDLIVYSATSENSSFPYYDGVYETLSVNPQSYYLLDKDDLIVNLQSDNVSVENEVVTARGNQLSLNERISKSLNDYGLNREYVFGEWYLRETRQRTRKRILGESKQLTVLNIGDSWTHNYSRYSGPLGLTLQDLFGDAGAGFTGFSWGFGSIPDAIGANKNFDPSTTYYTLQGAWTSAYNYTQSPDICAALSSDIGAYVDLTTTKEATHATLYANNNSAEIRYNFDDGAWTNLVLDGSDTFYTLTGMPVGTGFNLKIELVSGSAELYGVDLHNDNDGVIIHKVGATGSQLAQWATQSNTDEWKANTLNLAPNLVTILHGTNDQTTYTKAQFKTNGQTLIDNLREILPLADILLIAPCENGRDLPILMSDYQDAFQELAYENKCAFLNLQHVFGDEFSEYASTSPRNWFNADTIHPEPETGGRAIVDAVARTLLNI